MENNFLENYPFSTICFSLITVILEFMVARLTVIFFIIVCLEAGVALTLLPWMSFGGLGDWGDNHLLALLVETTGLPIIQSTVASPWFRGAITGLGVLNLFIAFWEIANFKKNVQIIEGKPNKEDSKTK
jgi:hypothetical protein